MAVIKTDIQKANPKLNQRLTVRTAHKCVHIIVHNCSIQHSTEQFWYLHTYPPDNHHSSKGRGKEALVRLKKNYITVETISINSIQHLKTNRNMLDFTSNRQTNHAQYKQLSSWHNATHICTLTWVTQNSLCCHGILYISEYHTHIVWHTRYKHFNVQFPDSPSQTSCLLIVDQSRFFLHNVDSVYSSREKLSNSCDARDFQHLISSQISRHLSASLPQMNETVL